MPICKSTEQICKYPKQENKTTKPIYKYTEQGNKSTRNVRLIKFLKTIRDYGVKPREGVGGNPVKVAKLKEARDIACNICTKEMATCGVAAEDRQQNGPSERG